MVPGVNHDVAVRPLVADIWPPCVRVTVVRSPVLQVGTLFIITADSPGTIGRLVTHSLTAAIFSLIRSGKVLKVLFFRHKVNAHNCRPCFNV